MLILISCTLSYQQRAARKQTVASLIEIELKFNDAAEKLSTFHSIELKKSLVGLRKLAIEAGIGKGDKILVTKEMFDLQMSDVLAPRAAELDSNVRGLAVEARKSHEGLGFTSTATPETDLTCVVDSIFSAEKSSALAKAAEIRQDEVEKADIEFSDWKNRKNQVAIDQAEKIRNKAAEEEEAKKRKEKLAKKAYKQWMKLRGSGKYVSPTDKKVHQLPPKTCRPDHDGRWSKDVEVVHAEIDYL